MSISTADDGILAHMERLIAFLEARTSEQTNTLITLANAGFDTDAAQETVWHSVDNLLALRRQHMQAREMLIETTRPGRSRLA